MSSIQNRLTVYIVAGTAILLIVVGITVDHLLRTQLEHEFDRNLLAKAMTLVSLTEQDWGIVEFDFTEEFMPEFDAPERPEYFQLWLADGTLLARSPSLGEDDLQRMTPTLEEPQFADLILPDGRLGRMVQITFVPPVDEPDEDDADEQPAPQEGPQAANKESDAMPEALGAEAESTKPDQSANNSLDTQSSDIHAHIVLVKGVEDLSNLITTMRTTLSVAFLGLMGALALLARISVGQGLKPLNRIAKEVEALDANNLHVRLTSEVDRDELLPIKNQLNHLLERLEEAFRREKRFSGNVAHELRTPIAELRALAEVGQEWPAERDMVQGFFGDLVDLADDMERTVVNLLMLARLDAGTQVASPESIDLADLIDQIWKRLGADTVNKEVRFDNRIGKDLHVESDKDKLTLILINILSNAVSYSSEHSAILVEAQETEAGIAVAVSNLTVDLTERDLSLMFERFWRKDQARTGGHHAGLGLSLVKALADVLNLRINPLLDANKRFTMALSGLTRA